MMGEWISVEDRLPKEGVEVIIVNENIYDCVDRARLRDGEWQVCDDEYRINPTHWIPFPKFPKREC